MGNIVLEDENTAIVAKAATWPHLYRHKRDIIGSAFNAKIILMSSSISDQYPGPVATRKTAL